MKWPPFQTATTCVPRTPREPYSLLSGERQRGTADIRREGTEKRVNFTSYNGIRATYKFRHGVRLPRSGALTYFIRNPWFRSPVRVSIDGCWSNIGDSGGHVNIVSEERIGISRKKTLSRLFANLALLGSPVVCPRYFRQYEHYPTSLATAISQELRRKQKLARFERISRTIDERHARRGGGGGRRFEITTLRDSLVYRGSSRQRQSTSGWERN